MTGGMYTECTRRAVCGPVRACVHERVGDAPSWKLPRRKSGLGLAPSPSFEARRGEEVDWETIRTNWDEQKSRLREEWPDLTEEDLREIDGSRERLLEKLTEKYSFSRVEAEAELEALRDRYEEGF